MVVPLSGLASSGGVNGPSESDVAPGSGRLLMSGTPTGRTAPTQRTDEETAGTVAKPRLPGAYAALGRVLRLIAWDASAGQAGRMAA
jgi:hypothetical protein